MVMVSKLFVLYDPTCGFCCRCRDWLLEQPKFIEIELMAKDGEKARRRFPELELGDDELVVVDNEGGLYRGPRAFVMCLYALVEYRGWSLRLSTPVLMPLARVGFELVSSKRHRIADWLDLVSDRDVADQLRAEVGDGTPRCLGG